MFDRELVAALGLCALGLAVAGVAAARPAPSVVTVTRAGEPLVTVLAARSG
ncbi:hypothetical protein SAMN02799631_06514 [Methylobacterium sp. 174MFSha1.1]|uniref:hypothetical protein n=1 Tax=Methylobacterium sp. 174MFSha1.1 TaxID=1502749 RepID=UPI0008F01C63|nr:hypothetical protein [Methylobacterium sp. 174MFSha1.1]SFV16765.1 hypothetical protein SAMN02799631_06514 [Methylobacterium sp. 174MFSha1.1]